MWGAGKGSWRVEGLPPTSLHGTPSLRSLALGELLELGAREERVDPGLLRVEGDRILHLTEQDELGDLGGGRRDLGLVAHRRQEVSRRWPRGAPRPRPWGQCASASRARSARTPAPARRAAEGGGRRDPARGRPPSQPRAAGGRGSGGTGGTG